MINEIKKAKVITSPHAIPTRAKPKGSPKRAISLTPMASETASGAALPSTVPSMTSAFVWLMYFIAYQVKLILLKIT
jgi:hypothetical protein